MASSRAPSRWNAGLLWLLGAWFALTAGMAYVASANFRVVEPDDLRNSAEVFGALAEGDERRQALRYVASEVNRHLFVLYGWTNLAFAVAALGLYFAARRPSRFVLASLLLCLAMAIPVVFYLTPAMVELGREIDFVARDPPPPEVARFYRLHGVDVVMEMVKLVLLPIVSVLVARRLS